MENIWKGHGKETETMWKKKKKTEQQNNVALTIF